MDTFRERRTKKTEDNSTLRVTGLENFMLVFLWNRVQGPCYFRSTIIFAVCSPSGHFAGCHWRQPCVASADVTQAGEMLDGTRHNFDDVPFDRSAPTNSHRHWRSRAIDSGTSKPSTAFHHTPAWQLFPFRPLRPLIDPGS